MFDMMKSMEERVGKLEVNKCAPAPGGGTSKRHELPPKPEGEGNLEVLRLPGPSANLNHDAPPFVNPKPNGSGPSYAMMAVKNTHGNNYVMDNEGFIVCGPETPEAWHRWSNRKLDKSLSRKQETKSSNQRS